MIKKIEPKNGKEIATNVQLIISLVKEKKQELNTKLEKELNPLKNNLDGVQQKIRVVRDTHRLKEKEARKHGGFGSISYKRTSANIDQTLLDNEESLKKEIKEIRIKYNTDIKIFIQDLCIAHQICTKHIIKIAGWNPDNLLAKKNDDEIDD